MKETQKNKLLKYPPVHVFSPSTDDEKPRIDLWAKRIEFCEHMLCHSMTYPTGMALGYWQSERDDAKREISLLITKKLLGAAA